MPGNDFRWLVQQTLGEAVRPYDRTFDELDRILPGADPELEPEAFGYVAEWFQPAEDNPGQLRQAADRRAQAVRWSLEHHGGVVEWLQAAGVDEPEA